MAYLAGDPPESGRLLWATFGRSVPAGSAAILPDGAFRFRAIPESCPRCFLERVSVRFPLTADTRGQRYLAKPPAQSRNAMRSSAVRCEARVRLASRKISDCRKGVSGASRWMPVSPDCDQATVPNTSMPSTLSKTSVPVVGTGSTPRTRAPLEDRSTRTQGQDHERPETTTGTGASLRGALRRPPPPFLPKVVTRVSKKDPPHHPNSPAGAYRLLSRRGYQPVENAVTTRRERLLAESRHRTAFPHDASEVSSEKWELRPVKGFCSGKEVVGFVWRRTASSS